MMSALPAKSFGGAGAKDCDPNHREAITPSEDFIISPHSACENLYVATCGSFHGWKFFPILGKYVVEMLDGLLDPALQKKWAWDRELPSTERNTFWPRKELKDFWDM
jgi:glycine/D-amino acid oxidase-like deaminating enzyme